MGRLRIACHTGGQYDPRPGGHMAAVRYDLAMSPLERHELIRPLERALVVISHPDDAEFGAAATIARLTAAGVRVDYVVTTDGAKGTEDPDVTPEQLAATRTAENSAPLPTSSACARSCTLGYPDGYLTPSLDLRRDITRQIRHFRPDLVITQNPQRRLDHNPFIGHPDHLATGEATLASVYPAASRSPQLPRAMARRGPGAVEGAPGAPDRRRGAQSGSTSPIRSRSVSKRSWRMPARSTATTSPNACASGPGWRGAPGHRAGPGVPVDHPRMTRRGGGGRAGMGRLRRPGAGPDAASGKRGAHVAPHRGLLPALPAAPGVHRDPDPRHRQHRRRQPDPP